MEFQNDFEVQAPIEQVWDTMLDVERVAPCVPGAQVLERTGDDSYKVGIKVRVGPVSMQYRGEVEIVERDPSSHSAVMTARAREARGQGTANANVRMHLSGNGETTKGSMITEVALSGRAAAMGQGVIKDVSEKIVDQFAENLAAMLGGGVPAAEPSVPSPQPAEPAAALAAQGSAPPAQEVPAPNPTAQPEPLGATPAAAQAEIAPETPTPSRPASPPPPPSSSDEGLDVVPIVRDLAAKRLRDPRVLGVLIVLLLLLLLRRRSH